MLLVVSFENDQLELSKFNNIFFVIVTMRLDFGG
jgi:hypothetical protein